MSSQGEAQYRIYHATNGWIDAVDPQPFTVDGFEDLPTFSHLSAGGEGYDVSVAGKGHSVPFGPFLTHEDARSNAVDRFNMAGRERIDRAFAKAAVDIVRNEGARGCGIDAR